MAEAVTRRIGVISDTHGLLRPEALAALEGSDTIIHGGDVGDAAILERLAEIAPVFAVRGNTDRGAYAERLPHDELVRIEQRMIYVLHDLGELELDPPTAGFDVVVSGHTHRPLIEWREGVLYLNPGSAGPRRFNLPITLARLTLHAGQLETEIVDLGV